MRRPETKVTKSHDAGVMTGEPQDTIVPTAKLIGEGMEVTCGIQDFDEKVTWDTCTQVNLVSETWLTANLLPSQYVRPLGEITHKHLVLQGVRSEIPYKGFTELSV